jgi:4-amino-4-deoxy-L-arabinose transferase-like glycosyltransferase
VAIFGLTPITVRLPSLLSAILTLPLVYFAAKRIFGDEKTALLCMFLLAISPWHILMSRWGINENILPFIFMLAFTFILTARTENPNYLIGCVFLAISLYVYGITYLAVPIFLGCATLLLLISKRASAKTVIPGLIIFTFLSTPVILFVLINTFKWQTIQLGFITIPRLPVLPRYEAVAAVFNEQSIRHTLAGNLVGMFKFLIRQTDGQIFNVVEPFGYLYTITFPLSVIGMILLFPFRKSPRAPERWMLLSWLAASFAIGVIQTATINRMNILFIPLFMCCAFFIVWVGKYSRVFFIGSILAFVVGFIFFTIAYHGGTYREQSAIRFFPGFLPAVDYARQNGSASTPICITDKVNMPYIFVEFSEQADPRQFLSTIKYKDPHADFRIVQSMERYTFGLKGCANLSGTIYITRYDETLPIASDNYAKTRFDNFIVFTPQH